MTEKKADKSLALCVISCIIPFICYGVERLVYYQNLTDTKVVLLLAFVFTALTGLLFMLMSKQKCAFYGLISSILAFKMMPPAIASIGKYSVNGMAVYSIVRLAALVLFAILIVKFIRMQNATDKPFALLPIIALVFTMSILREVSYDIYSSLYVIFDGSLYGVYFAQAVIYIWAVAIIYVTSFKSNLQTAKFISTFQIIAMGINIVRRLGTIAVHLINNTHISASYYCWILIYLIVMFAFAILPQRMQKSQSKKA